MLQITASILRVAASVVAVAAVAASAATAQGIYSPSVVHGTSRSAPIAQPAAPLQPAAPASGVTSIAPSVVLGWGGLPPSVGAPPGFRAPVQPVIPGYAFPGHPVHVVPIPVYPHSYGPVVPAPYPLSPYRPDPSSGPLHRWSTP